MKRTTENLEKLGKAKLEMLKAMDARLAFIKEHSVPYSEGNNEQIQFLDGGHNIITNETKMENLCFTLKTIEDARSYKDLEDKVRETYDTYIKTYKNEL